MKKHRITKRFEIDAGHRLQKHESKCRNVHGHRYAFEVTIETAQLDAVGRVIDFGDVKRRVGSWLDEQLDHGFIVEAGDPLLEVLRAEGSKVFVVGAPPTIEHLVEVVASAAIQALADLGALEVVEVVGFETPTCWATWRVAR